MKWFLLAFVGVILNSAGLCFFGDAIIHRAMANGAMAAGFLNGIIGLVLINAGICLIVEAAKWRGRD
jgi:hypothetical protein